MKAWGEVDSYFFTLSACVVPQCLFSSSCSALQSQVILLRLSCSFGPPLSQFVGAHGWCANHPLGFETSLSRSQSSPSTSSFQTDLSQRTTLAIQVPASKCTTRSCSIMVEDNMILYILGSTLVKASGRSWYSSWVSWMKPASFRKLVTIIL